MQQLIVYAYQVVIASLCSPDDQAAALRRAAAEVGLRLGAETSEAVIILAPGGRPRLRQTGGAGDPGGQEVTAPCFAARSQSTSNNKFSVYLNTSFSENICTHVDGNRDI